MVDAMCLGAWLRFGEAIGWLAAGTIPNSLNRVPFFYQVSFSDICFVFKEKSELLFLSFCRFCLVFVLS